MHYSLIVIGNESLRDVMAPYSENLEVPEYCAGEVPEADRQRMVDFYNEHTTGRHYALRTFDELYAEKGYDWNINRWRKGEDGVWREFSTYNPDSKWDWYEVGGRWAGQIQVKDGVDAEPVHFSWGWDEEEKRKVRDARPRRTDMARKGDIVNLDTLSAWSVLKDGEWHEAEWREGFDGCLKASDFLEGVSDDTFITCVDYHI